MRPGDEVAGVVVERILDTRDGVSAAWGRDREGIHLEVLWSADEHVRARLLASFERVASVDGLGPLRVESVYVVRAATGGTLERLRGPLDPTDVAGVGAAVAPLLAASGLKRLHAHDLAASADGVPVLAPRFGRDDRLGDPAKDLAGLLYQWWTGRALDPLVHDWASDLDPRAARAVLALLGSDLEAAATELRAMAPGPVDLRPALARRLDLAPVATTRTGGDPDSPVGGFPVRAAAWTAAILVWLVSLAAAFTVVLAPLAALGAALGAAIGLGGEIAARRTAGRLVDRTLGGRLTGGWSAAERARASVSAAGLPEPTAVDAREIVRGWERDLTALAENGAGHLHEAEAASLQRRVVDEARHLERLVGRLAADDEAAGPELARWVRSGAP